MFSVLVGDFMSCVLRENLLTKTKTETKALFLHFFETNRTVRPFSVVSIFALRPNLRGKQVGLLSRFQLSELSAAEDLSGHMTRSPNCVPQTHLLSYVHIKSLFTFPYLSADPGITRAKTRGLQEMGAQLSRQELQRYRLVTPTSRIRNTCSVVPFTGD